MNVGDVVFVLREGNVVERAVVVERRSRLLVARLEDGTEFRVVGRLLRRPP